MLRLLGGALLALAAAYAGFAARGRLSRRVALLTSLAAALAQFDRELSFRLTAMPEWLARAAAESPPAAAAFFRNCLNHLNGEVPFAELWQSAAAELPDLTAAERQTLSALGGVLGRYDSDAQRTALARADAALAAHITAAAAERDRLGRVYTALGVSSGALLFILIL